MPMAVIRPSSRLAKSHRMSASLIGPVGALGDLPVVGAAAARIDDDALTGQARPGAADQLLLADRVNRATRDPGTQKVQGAQRFWAADAVGRHSVLALIRHQRVVGLQPEVAVDQPGVEAEVLQPRLQRGDVVAVHRRAELVTEGARPEPVGRFLQRAIRRLADDAVDEQAPVLLERAHGLVEFEVEIVERRRACRCSDPSSGLSTSPSAASAVRISVTAPPRSPRRRLDITWALSITHISGGPALTMQDRLGGIISEASADSRKRQAGRPAATTRASDDVGELAQQRGLAFRADDALHRRTVLEQDHRRDRHHLEVARGGGVRRRRRAWRPSASRLSRRRSPRAPGRPSCTARTRWPRSPPAPGCCSTARRRRTSRR